MFDKLIELRDALRGVLAGFEPGCYSGPDASRLVETFAEVERLAAAGKALAARRVEESNLWRREGFRSAAEWTAAKTGTSVGQAVGVLKTARCLEELPETNEAFRCGRLSETQAREVTAAAVQRPESEAALLQTVGTGTVADLRDRCRRVMHTGTEAERAYELLHRSRYLRHWTDHDGALRFDARLTPDDGARVLAAMTPRQQRLMVEGQAAGRREPAEAYAADALVDLARGEVGPVAMVQVRVDRDALVRGHTEEGETCDIPGVGPIPVSAAHRLADDAVLRVVVSDGVDVTAVAHPGRTIPAHLRSPPSPRPGVRRPRLQGQHRTRDRPPHPVRPGRRHHPRQSGPPLQVAPPSEDPPGMDSRRRPRTVDMDPARRRSPRRHHPRLPPVRLRLSRPG